MQKAVFWFEIGIKSAIYVFYGNVLDEIDNRVEIVLIMNMTKTLWS